MFNFCPNSSFISNLLRKLFDCNDRYFRPINLFENVEMRIIGNYVFGIRSNRTIYKFVIINILLYQPEMNIDFLINRCV